MVVVSSEENRSRLQWNFTLTPITKEEKPGGDSRVQKSRIVSIAGSQGVALILFLFISGCSIMFFA
jgi:hypothetical protein